ncbi:tRNA (adenosine(37)-N6)-threonylcarbamoyltransferase complex dimerization subunit type 1 TsaB [Paenibacillus humicola]|uniref:tRNA (adenosine(37)-N6)-threonylcarbamoyltransferase complex dimerization subunit type 1 TsaB n=1 Tax=Paenibacillus humicola TaxID=3110540 RepID=UPI00237AF403|nr:tRNA (adenosine(37)-N6)-threonylcarbamoyltransferase complex dimerization subunit type 1 TsaB [Paenibacillus humicola]
MTGQQAEGREAADGPLMLAVDTSTAALAAAVVRGGTTLASLQTMAERNHSVQTVPQIKALLERSGVAPESLDGLAVGRGPGSYTGMRIAVAVGKTLAWVWNKPLVGVSSLEALAYGAMCEAADGADEAAAGDIGGEFGRPADLGEVSVGRTHPAQADGIVSPEEWYIPIMDARRGQVYTAAFASQGGRESWSRLEDDGIRLMKDWVDRVNGLRLARRNGEAPFRIWIVGDFSLHEAEGERLRSLCEAEISYAGSRHTEVRLLPAVLNGSAVAALGMRRIARGERDEAHTFVPNYTQLAEAEVKLLARQAGQAGEAGGR